MQKFFLQHNSSMPVALEHTKKALGLALTIILHYGEEPVRKWRVPWPSVS